MKENKKRFVRFPNESYFTEIEFDEEKFAPIMEFENEIFGHYGDICLSLKK